MARTIESPGVQINEIDLSQNASLPVGTNVFVTGFAAQGPTLELVNVTSKSELEQIYGKPTTEAERYFFNTCSEILNSPANLLVSRLPYGTANGDVFSDDYTALFFPVTGKDSAEGGESKMYSQATYFEIGKPTMLKISESDYIKIKSGQITWAQAATSTPTTNTMGKCGFIIVNKNKVTTDEYAQGFYMAIIDNSVRNTIATDVEYTGIQGIESVTKSNKTTFSTLESSTLGFKLTGTHTAANNSISEQAESGFQYNFKDPSYNDSLMFTLLKLGRSNMSQSENKLYVKYAEKYIGSLDKYDTERPGQQVGQAESFFIESVVNNKSNFIEIYVNPNLSEGPEWTNSDGERKCQTRINEDDKKAYALGMWRATNATTDDKTIGDVPAKIQKTLMLAENKEVIDIDIVCEAGLGTVYSYAKAKDEKVFDPAMNIASKIDELKTDVNADIAKNYNNVFNMFANFVSETRKDCIFLADPIRGIFIQGEDFKVIQDKSKNFSQHIYNPLKNLYSTSNNNYIATYGNWVKAYDAASDTNRWMPFSGYEAAIMARLDANLYPWHAPAGLENGIVRNIVDIAINPSQKQRDLLYKVGINPVVFFPRDAYVVWGQKTLQAKPSAFDRINVRRLFLTLEKATLRLTRYFVMQPNTVFTRTRLVNYLTPIFDIAKQNDGVYDYLIVCDERNNTPDVIDNNELKLDIYIKAVRTAEFILVGFYATRTGADFNELIR